MATPKFQRTVEDFTCENCGHEVEGSGYTNHCPRCLWSKHVDVNPGDRAADCGGLMRPVAVEVRGDQYRILQRCEQCGHEHWNKASPQDDFEALLALAKEGGAG